MVTFEDNTGSPLEIGDWVMIDPDQQFGGLIGEVVGMDTYDITGTPSGRYTLYVRFPAMQALYITHPARVRIMSRANKTPRPYARRGRKTS